MKLGKSLQDLENAYNEMYLGIQKNPPIIELRKKITEILFKRLSEEDFFRMFSSIGSSINSNSSQIIIPYQLSLKLAWLEEKKRLENLGEKPTAKIKYAWEDSNRGIYPKNLINEDVWGFKEWLSYQALLFPANELSENSDESFLLLKNRANSKVSLYHFKPVLREENPFIKVDPNSKLEILLDYRGNVPIIHQPVFEYLREIEQNELPEAERNVVWISCWQDNSLFNVFYEGIKRHSKRSIEDLQEKRGNVPEEKLQAVYNALISEPIKLN
ncbi:hypothetical protein COU54_02250 [Candidatus Pacearchaeota archaeon CG10_big_fil_rev_8_21_14_0_10_31_24]|nr:MAG: hypothetical protein COU54_02250 [Candidatus Pacearchaeota archaeon CG10_big_fil_rev_8_21_14_0_10_31_24]